MIWKANNGDLCATPPEQIVQSEYMRFGYDMRVFSDQQKNRQRDNSQKQKAKRRKHRESFAEAIGDVL